MTCTVLSNFSLVFFEDTPMLFDFVDTFSDLLVIVLAHTGLNLSYCVFAD